MPSPVTVLYSTSATATGGRNGHTQNADGLISLDLSVPKAMGGPGKPGTSTPEDLFAAGYSACFGSAVEFVARQKKVHLKEVQITARVSIGTVPEGGFGLVVALEAHLPEVSKEVAEGLVAEAHQVCPYSKATRGNVDVTLSVK